MKEGLTHCHDCDRIKYRNLKTPSKTITYSPNETRSQEDEILIIRSIYLFSSFLIFSLQ